MDNNEANRVMNRIDQAIHSGSLATVEVKDKAGKPLTVLCEMWKDEKGNVALAPLARLFQGDPNDEVILPEGGVSVIAQSGADAIAQAFGGSATAPV